MLSSVLIANRGEIAVRIIRTARRLGMRTIAVHSDADRDALFVRLADEAHRIGPAPASESYLNIPAILSAATITGADAIHPGIGFMAENARFAEMVEEHGFAFIGPAPEHIRMMGDKITAKKSVLSVGLPVVPGSDGPVAGLDEALAVGDRIGFPVLVKASAGGGGKGMKVARDRDEMPSAYSLARSEAKAAFGDDSVYIEKFLTRPRHIEVQILADEHGNAIELGSGRFAKAYLGEEQVWWLTQEPVLQFLAEREEIDVRTYSIIYNAIEDVRDALEGLLSPEETERTIGVAEVRDIFKVPRAGTVAGCYIVEGRIHRNDSVRLIREGVVIYEGDIASLKRFKDDVREVQTDFECGLSIENYDDIKVGDQIEAYEVVEEARTLEASQ